MALPTGFAAWLITLGICNPAAEQPQASSLKTPKRENAGKLPSKYAQNRPQRPLRTKLKQNR